MNKPKLTKKDIKQKLDEVFDSKSNFKMNTGRSGAINYEIELRAQLNPTKPKSEIVKEVNSKVWEEGVYDIDDSGCKYLGLWDNTMQNGIHLVKRNDLWYLENWVNGYRYEYQIISEEIANLLKDKKSIIDGLKLELHDLNVEYIINLINVEKAILLDDDGSTSFLGTINNIPISLDWYPSDNYVVIRDPYTVVFRNIVNTIEEFNILLTKLKFIN